MSTTSPHHNGHSDVRTYRGRKLEDLIPQIRAEMGPDAIILREREGLMGGLNGFFAHRCVEVDVQAGPRIDTYDELPEDAFDVELEQASASVADEPPAPSALESADDEEPPEALAVIELPENDVPRRVRRGRRRVRPAANGEPAAFETEPFEAEAEPEAFEVEVEAEAEAEALAIEAEPEAFEVEVEAEPEALAIETEPEAFEVDVDEEPEAIEIEAEPQALQTEPEPEAVEVEPEPEVIEIEPQIVQPEMVEPQMVEPEMVEPEVFEPEPVAMTPAPMPAPALAPAPTSESLDDEESVAGALAHEGISPAWAADLIAAAGAHRRPFAGSGGLRDAVRAMLASSIPAIRPLPPAGAAIAFVGSGGAGKTRCAASLATAYSRGSTLSVSVVSLGSAGRDREIKDLLRNDVVAITEATGEGAQRAVAAGRDRGLVIVDTAATTPADPAAVLALAEELGQLQLDAIYVTVPATLSPRAAGKLIESFAPLNPTGIAVTHVDEADQLGIATELSYLSSLPIAYINEGLNGGSEFCAADPWLLATRLLR